MNEIDIALLDYDTSAEVDARLPGPDRGLVLAPHAESCQIFNLVQEQFTPCIVRNLLLEAPLVGDAILGNQSHVAAPLRLLKQGRSGRTLPADQRSRAFGCALLCQQPLGAEGGGIFNLVQTQFTPRIFRNLLCQTPLRPTHPGQRVDVAIQLALGPQSTTSTPASRPWRTAAGSTPPRTSRSTA